MPEEKRQPQVFLSYSRKDLAFVEQLAADLKAAGLDVWYDLSGLEGGARWRIEIEKAIRESQYVVVILSPDSVASMWVEEEILYARNLKRKIVPLFYKSCDIPLGFQSLHFIDVQEDKYKRNFGEMLRALEVGSDGISTVLNTSKRYDTLHSGKQVLSILVTGGRKTSEMVINLARLIGYQVIMKGHILLNHGTRGVDSAAAEGARKACIEKGYLNEDFIKVYRPKQGLIPEFDYVEPEKMGDTYEERRALVIEKSDVVIILGGGSGTRDVARQAQISRIPLIPIGIGDSKETAVDIWQRMLNGESFGDFPISRHDLRKLGNQMDHEKLAADAVILAKLLLK